MIKGGNVIGVAVAKLEGEGIEGFNFGIKSSVLKSFSESNNVRLITASRSKMSQTQLTNLVTEGTVYIDCWLTISDIEKIIKQSSEKAFIQNIKIKRLLDLTTILQHYCNT